jgi:hypothetical protein
MASPKTGRSNPFGLDPVADPRNLKKWTYQILKKLQVLTIPSTATELYSIRRNGDFYVVLCLTHIRECIACALDSSDDDVTKSKLHRYLSSLDHLIRTVRRNAERNLALDKRALPRVLRRHTGFFNVVLDRQPQFVACPEEWSRVSQTALRIWGNDPIFSRF